MAAIDVGKAFFSVTYRLCSYSSKSACVGKACAAPTCCKVCTHCGGTAVADELHMIHECPVLQPFRLQYAALFTPDTDTMRSFSAQQDHMQVFKFVLDCLDFLKL